MEHWEFLIQKQGDRAWRTLETPIVEITEGRYRVVARSNRSNLDVDVEVTHSSTLEFPPKPRIQKRSRRTNRDGLMVVIPYTYLKAGIWELRCSGDLMSAFLGISWQYSIYLQVSPILAFKEVGRLGGGETIEQEEEREVSSSASTTLNLLGRPTQQNQSIVDEPVSPVWLKGETAEQILKNVIELALPSSESLLEDETTSENSPVTTPEPPLLLNLEQETYVAHWGGNLTISGRVELQPTTSLVLNETLNSQTVFAGELRIELYSPQEAEILTEMRQPLPAKLLPLNIKCSVEIPYDWESKVILAEMRLYGALAGYKDDIKLLASKSFTITADVTQLLAISTTAHKNHLDTVDEPSESPASPIAFTTSKPDKPIKLELFNLVKTPTKTDSLQPSPLLNDTLPPEIASPEPDKKTASVQLPTLPQDKTKTMSAPMEVSQSSIQVHDLVKRHAVSLELPKLPRPIIKTTSAETVVSQSSIQVHNLENHDTSISPVTTIGTHFPYLRRIKPIAKKKAFNWQLGTKLGVVRNPIEQQGVKPTVRQVLQLPKISPPPLDLSQQSRTPIADDENAYELAASVNVQSEDNQLSAGVMGSEDSPELAASVNVQSQDNQLSTGVMESNFGSINVDNSQLSPLIRKWIDNQQHSLAKPIYVLEQNQDDENNLIESQKAECHKPLDPPVVEGTALEAVDVTFEPNEITAIKDSTQYCSDKQKLETRFLGETGFLTPQRSLTEQYWDSTDVITALTDLIIDEPSVTTVMTPTTSHTKVPLTRFAEEIVVDNTCVEPTATNLKHTQQEKPLSEVSKITEPLGTPQLCVPNGELVSGRSIRVFIQLPDRRPQLGVKLWVEDCQTRWLLDGPRLLTNLLPNSSGGLEVMTEINIPFGCLEIRVEAIALDLATQQESRKVSAHRTVIPPDLPNLPIDEFLHPPSPFVCVKNMK